jgi:hypothetical protein
MRAKKRNENNENTRERKRMNVKKRAIITMNLIKKDKQVSAAPKVSIYICIRNFH